MEKVSVRLTVFFEEPFWVGVFERRTGRGLEACKHTFGAEPKDAEVYGLVLRDRLRFSPCIADGRAEERHMNPKRMQRAVSRQLGQMGVGTKAQQALQAERERSKQERTVRTREQRDEEKERQFELHVQKKKEKHRGH